MFLPRNISKCHANHWHVQYNFPVDFLKLRLKNISKAKVINVHAFGSSLKLYIFLINMC